MAILSPAELLNSEAADVNKKLQEIKAYGTIPSSIPEEHILRQAKLSMTIDNWMEENECDARACKVDVSGAVKGHVAPGPMTFFRISTDDPEGRIKACLGEGEFTDDPFDMDGCIAVCRVTKVRKLLAYLCKNGFEHRVAMTRRHCAGIGPGAIQESAGILVQIDRHSRDSLD